MEILLRWIAQHGVMVCSLALLLLLLVVVVHRG